MKDLKPQLSKKNKYWLHKSRYYELKHFCRQYGDMKKHLYSIDGLDVTYSPYDCESSNTDTSDPTSRTVQARLYYGERIKMIEEAAKECCEYLGSYVLKGVTEGLSYDSLYSRLEIPCARETYYLRYRKFFWILDKKRR